MFNSKEDIILPLKTYQNKGIILEQMDLNKRLILALMLSFFILFGFSYLFPQPKKSNSEINATQKVQSSQASPAPQTAKSAPQTSAQTKNAPKKVTNQASADGVLATVETKKYKLKIDSLGRFSSVTLKESKYKDEKGNPLELLDPKRTRPLEVRFADSTINEKAFKVNYSSSLKDINASNSKQSITLTQNLGDVTISKILTFYPEGHYDLSVKVSKNIDYFITTGHRPEADKSMYMIVRGALVRDANGIITTFEDDDIKESKTLENITILSSFDRYYSSLFFNFDKPFSVVVAPDAEGSPLAFVKSNSNLELKAYVGPKEWKLFESLDRRLTDAIEFGWFTFLAKPFFKIMLLIYNFIGNWGWAIVIFTILIKLILFPLSYKGMMSMQKLKDLAPKMKELKEKYKDDPAKMNMKMMELYKRHGANPMGGCLPMLLQIPVFFALYRVLLNADELQGAPWIWWITDLSKQDPYFVLPILMGATMYIQQVITPNTMTDPMQQKIFRWFPVIMTFFFLTFPAGLVLYWLTNNILSIAQQQYINFAYEKYKKEMKMKTDSKKDEKKK